MATIALTQANFDQVIANNTLVFVDFWAMWCGPCLAFAPIYEQVAQKFPDILFAKVDIEAEPELAADFNIRSIPQLLVIKKKIVIFAEAGLLPATALIDLVEQGKAIDVSSLQSEICQQEKKDDGKINK
jgi:thioredoxin